MQSACFWERTMSRLSYCCRILCGMIDGVLMVSVSYLLQFVHELKIHWLVEHLHEWIQRMNCDFAQWEQLDQSSSRPQNIYLNHRCTRQRDRNDVVLLHLTLKVMNEQFVKSIQTLATSTSRNKFTALIAVNRGQSNIPHISITHFTRGQSIENASRVCS